MFNKSSLKTACAAAAFSLAVASSATSEEHIDILEKNCATSTCHVYHTIEQLTTNYPFKVNLKDRINRSEGDPKLMPKYGTPLNSRLIKTLETWIDAEFNQPLEELSQIDLSLDQLKLIKDHNNGRLEIIYFVMERYDEIYEDALRKLINSLSWNKELVLPQPLDYGGTIFYVDAKKLKWNPSIRNILKESYPPFRHYEQIILPIDWFIVNASDARFLYHEILFPNINTEYELVLGNNSIRALDPDTGGAFNELQMSVDSRWTKFGPEFFNSEGVYGKESGRTDRWTSGVSFENRILDRLKSNRGVYWKSYDFAEDEEYNDIFNDGDNLRHFGNEMIFSLPNGLHAYFITNRKGRRLDVAPYTIVKHPYDSNVIIIDSNNDNKPDLIPNPNGDGNILDHENNGNIINGISCMKCHSNGIIRFEDETGGILKTSDQPDLNGLITEDNDRYRSQLEFLTIGSNSYSMDSVIAIYDRFSKETNPVVAAPASPPLPQGTKLLANYPNPSNPETWIPYYLETATEVTIYIYNITGRLVRTLDLGQHDAGWYRDKSRAAYWDGRNEVGERVASGIYFYTLQTQDLTVTRKMIIRK